MQDQVALVRRVRPGRLQFASWPWCRSAPAGATRASTRLVMFLLIIILVEGSEKHFRRTLGQERASALLEALQTSSKRARAVAAQEGFSEARTEPAVAFDLAVKSLTNGFAQMTGVRSTTVNGQRLWIIDDYALRVKKLRSGYRSSNHHSGQQELMSHQFPLPGFDPLIYVTAGAVYSDLTGLAQQFVVVKHRIGPMHRQQVEWVVDLDELAAGELVPATPILPLPTTPAAPAAVSAKRASDQTPGVGHQAG